MSAIELLDLDAVSKIIEIAKEFDENSGEELDLDDAPIEALWRIQEVVDAANPAAASEPEPEAKPQPQPQPEADAEPKAEK